MKYRFVSFTCIFSLAFAMLTAAQAQPSGVWQGKRCAVVLTYDDALDVDLDHAVPALDSLGLKATFYLSGYSGALDKRVKEWRAIAANGHELGNHTLFHPCTGSLPGRGFVTPDYDLNNYSVKRMTDEITMTNAFLKAIDGNSKRTFAYPCGDTKIHDTDYLQPVQNQFVAARGVQAQMHGADLQDMYNIGCYVVNGQSDAQLIALAQEALQRGQLLVFLFHGVGGGHSLDVSLDAHRQLLRHLKAHEKEIWVAPMLEVAEYIQQQQSKK